MPHQRHNHHRERFFPRRHGELARIAGRHPYPVGRIWPVQRLQLRTLPHHTLCRTEQDHRTDRLRFRSYRVDSVGMQPVRSARWRLKAASRADSGLRATRKPASTAQKTTRPVSPLLRRSRRQRGRVQNRLRRHEPDPGPYLRRGTARMASQTMHAPQAPNAPARTPSSSRTDFGQASVNTRGPSAVTSASSSMRTPMPRSARGTLRSRASK